MAMKKYCLWQFLLWAVYACDACGDDTRGSITLEGVTITAQRFEADIETGDVDINLNTGFVNEIKIDRTYGKMDNLAEIMEKEAGIQLRQFGGLGSFSTASIRGASSNQTMIFIDGMILNDAFGGIVDLSNISLSDVDAIEIYHGITPINFGKVSIGGAINIRTRRNKKGLNTSITTALGSFGTRRLAGFTGHNAGAWSYLLSAEYLDSRNDFATLNDNGTRWNKDDDRWQKRSNAQFNQKNLLVKAGYRIAEHVRINILNQLFSKRQGLPSWNNDAATTTSLFTLRNKTQLKVIADNVGPYSFNMNLALDMGYKKQEYDDRFGRFGQIGLGRQHDRNISNSRGAHYFLEAPWKTHILRLLLEAQRQQYRPQDLLNNSPRASAARDSHSIGLQNHLFLMEDRLFITPGISFSRIRDESNAISNHPGDLGPPDAVWKGYTNPQLGIMYRPHTWLTVKSNIARYTREPSFFELFGDRGFFIGNDELRAETGINFDFGFDLRYRTGTPLQRISWRVAYYQSEVADIITRIYDSQGVGKSVNISRSRINGIESSLKADLFKHFNVTVNATWQAPINYSENTASNYKYLPGRFQRSYLGKIEIKKPNIKYFAEYRYESGLFYDTANLLKAPDKKAVNAGITYFFSSFSLTLEGKNLLNKQYEDFYRYPQPGRSFYATLKYNRQSKPAIKEQQ